MSSPVLPPIVDVVEALPLSDYRMALLFEDGKRSTYDASSLIGAGVFHALEDLLVFNTLRIEYGTVVWPGGIDIAAEELYGNCISV